MILLERNLRLELSQLEPMEAIFKLTALIEIEKDTVPEDLIRLFGTTMFQYIVIDTCKVLRKELVETGRITPPN